MVRTRVSASGLLGRFRPLLIAAAGLCLFAFLGLVALAYRPPIAEVMPPDPSRFPAALVASGERLARIGNCLSCHQAAHGRPFAGGTAIRSAFGTIYGSNITPDPDTGIGRWSQAAFIRAMREGVGRNGRQLYPALPYDHFQYLTGGDLAALYAFLMTRDPVKAIPPANRLIPPLGFRPVIAGWKLLFFRHDAAPAAVGAADPAWARGRYLGEALAHCGGCHTPRNVFQAEERSRAYTGGRSEGWYAPPIGAQSPAVRAWTVARLETYLRTGLSPSHAAAAGPMGAVAHNLSQVPVADVHALAVYYASLMAQAPAGRREPTLPDREAEAARAFPEGATLFAGACAACHGAGAPMMVAGRPPLPLGTPLHENNPRDTIQIILQGLNPPVGARGPYMPAFADSLSDGQVAAIVGYLRARYGTGPAWPDLPRAVAKARKEGER